MKFVLAIAGIAIWAFMLGVELLGLFIGHTLRCLYDGIMKGDWRW